MEAFDSREVCCKDILSIWPLSGLNSSSITTNVEDKFRPSDSLLQGISDRSDEINLQLPYPNQLIGVELREIHDIVIR